MARRDFLFRIAQRTIIFYRADGRLSVFHVSMRRFDSAEYTSTIIIIICIIELHMTKVAYASIIDSVITFDYYSRSPR